MKSISLFSMGSKLKDIIENVKDEFLELIPNILIALIVLVIGYAIALLVKYLIVRLIFSIGKLASRRFDGLNFKQAGAFIGVAFFWLIIFSSVVLIADILGLSMVTVWFQGILHYIPNLLAAILIIFAAIILGNILSNIITSVCERLGLEYSGTLVKIAKFLLLLTAIIIAMDQIGIEISFLINIIDIVLAALLFGAALAFGLGAQTSISNILSAFYVRRSYREGDEIQIGKIRGTIVKIEATRVILDNDKGQVTIPAKEFNTTESYLIKKD